MIKKNLKKITLLITVFLFVLIFCNWNTIMNKIILPITSKNVKILNVKLENGQINVLLSDNAKCSLDDITSKSDKWVISVSKICTFDFHDRIEKVYIVDKYNRKKTHIINKEFGIVDELKSKDKKIYLAVGASKKIDYNITSRGTINDVVKYTSSNSDVASVSDDGIIYGASAGEASITLSLSDKEQTIDVIVTNLITIMPEEPNVVKPLLQCNIYSKEDNDLLDEILMDRVKSAGYETRAGVVAAARFLTLEFPYRIGYFSENGRLSEYGGVDGEGRYYHQGLYLNSSRFSTITHSMYGPATWGCYMYSVPTLKAVSNGLDCSGFITWILKQAGYESGDLGAGINPGYPDMTDLGPKDYLSNALNEGKVKVGDLLSGNGETTNAWSGGHIAMLVGIHDGNYYVAEEMWFGTGYFGAIMRKYSLEEFKYYFYWHISMDDFYGTDGNLTDYWL